MGAVPLPRPRQARVHLVPVRRARLLPARRLRRVETRAPRRRQKLPPMDALIRLDRQNTLPSLSPHPVAGRSLALLLIAMHLRSTALLLMLLLLHPRRFQAPLLHRCIAMSSRASDLPAAR